MTNMPIRNCMTRSFMTILAGPVGLAALSVATGRAASAGTAVGPMSSSIREVLAPTGQLAEPFAGLAADELADARVGAVFEPVGGAVEEDLRLAGLEPGERVEHDHAVGHLDDRLHVVRHDDAGRLLGALGLEDQLVDDVAHDRVEPGGRLVVEHDLGVERQGPGQADALAQAAGELGGLLVLEAVGAGRPPGAARRRPGRASRGRRGRARGGRRRRCRRSSGCRTGRPSGTGSRTAAGPGSARARRARRGRGRRSGRRPGSAAAGRSSASAAPSCRSRSRR